MAANNNLYALDAATWDRYLKGRPQVPDSFFKRIFDYHAQHSRSFDVVHDGGAGVGVHSKRLAMAFRKVIVTDSSDDNIARAKELLGNHEEKFDVRTAKLEESDDVLGKSSVDLVFVANALHWTDVDKALQAIIHQLKPGGTLAVAQFAIARFHDAEVQDLWLRLFHSGLKGSFQKSPWLLNPHRGAAVSSSDLDSLYLDDEATWKKGVQRVKLNFDNGYTMYHYLPPGYEHVFSGVSKVGVNDVAVAAADQGWDFAIEMGGFNDMIASFAFERTEELLALLKDLETVVGEREVSGVWPASLVMATKL